MCYVVDCVDDGRYEWTKNIDGGVPGSNKQAHGSCEYMPALVSLDVSICYESDHSNGSVSFA